MSEKKYAIVRADKFCPRDLERNYKLKCIGSLRCNKCDLRKKYGDTKEQLIRKVAQVLFRKEIRLYKKFCGGDINSIFKKNQSKWCLKTAKEIVEFLGVE